jgi:hypothetical protein
MQSQAPHRSRQQLCCAIKAIDAIAHAAGCRRPSESEPRTEHRAALPPMRVKALLVPLLVPLGHLVWLSESAS